MAIGDSNEGSDYWKYASSENEVRVYNPTVKGIDSIITIFTPSDAFLFAPFNSGVPLSL